MNIVRDVLRELRGMFVADVRLTIGIAVLIAVVSALVEVFAIEPLAAGVVLLIGCLAILIETAIHQARCEVSR